MARDDTPFIFRLNENGNGPSLLQQVCLERGWRTYSEYGFFGGEWNLWWRTKGFPVSCCNQLDKCKFTNHIPNASFICRKDNLIRNLKCMKKVYGTCYNFFPEGFHLPLEYKKVLELCKSDEKARPTTKEIWICKPVGQSQGRGISLFEDASDLVYHSNAVVQRYVKNPLLIGGYKFDLRLYVLVPSFHPLTVYIYQEGLARFGTEKFSLNNLKNRFAHLTNSSLNRLGPGYLEIKERVGTGCKWSLQQLRCYFQQTLGSDWLLWQNIATIIVHTVASQLSKVPKTTNCFEFYGFDVLIDASLKPWLIEVNLSPALGIDCNIDPDVKKPMLHDMFDLLGLPVCNTGLSLYTIYPIRPQRSNSVLKLAAKCVLQSNREKSSRRLKICDLGVWSNGKDWNKPAAKEGNWVRVFPLLLADHNRIKLVKPPNSSMSRTFNTDEINAVVSSLTSYSKMVKEIFARNSDANDETLNESIIPYLCDGSKIWLPPI